MSNINVKKECFASNSIISLCHACLSTDRTLSNATEYVDIFWKLFDDQLILPDMLLCWECVALLKRVRIFTRNVADAQIKMQHCDTNRQDPFPLSLSTLITSPIDYMTTVEYKEQLQTVIKMEIEQAGPFETSDNFDSETDNRKEETEITILKGGIELKIEHVNAKSDEDYKGESKELKQAANTFVNPKIGEHGVLLMENMPVNVNGVDRLNSNVEGKDDQDEGSGDETSDEDTSDDSDSVLSIERLCLETDSSNVNLPWSQVRMTREEMIEWRDRKKNIEFYTGSVYKCQKCFEPFENKTLYGAHKKRHAEDNGDFACYVCEQRCWDRTALNIHMNSHYSLLKCKFCAHQWDSPNAMRRHCRDAHGVPIAEWECDQCDHRFPSVQKLAVHSHSHRARRCPECGQLLRSSLSRHMLRQHRELPLRRCGQCSVQCRGDSGLREHMKRHVKKVDDTTYCAECKLQFQSNYVYRSHMRNTVKHAAAEDLRFKCAECGKSFLDNFALTNHIDAIHDKQDKYPCDRCDEAFRTVVARRRHVRAAHEGRGPAKHKVCHYCGKAFTTEILLVQHINSHTGARPYKCKLCVAAFGSQSVLYRHGRFIHNIKKKTER